MKLTRRDALAVLAGTGVVGGGGAAVLSRGGRETTDALDALVATAEVVYPSEVSGVRAFVETYSLARFEGREGYRDAVEDAVAALDDHARAWHDAPYVDLDAATRDDLLRSMGVPTAEEDPEGSTAERVRFYVVNELLYALYASPAGGRLVGIENPQGHPGGTTSYRRGPR